MRSLSIRASLLVMLLFALYLFPQDDPQQIMQKSYDAMTLAGSESISTLTISDGKGNQRVRTFSSAQKTEAGQVTKIVMRFLEPADVKGTGILTFDYENKDDDVARKTEYYDLNGALVKVMTTDKVELFDAKNKKYQPVDITMHNRQNGRSSRIVIDKLQFNPNVKEEYFTTAYLEK
jgi:hypothetical protein